MKIKEKNYSKLTKENYMVVKKHLGNVQICEDFWFVTYNSKKLDKTYRIFIDDSLKVEIYIKKNDNAIIKYENINYFEAKDIFEVINKTIEIIKKYENGENNE